MFGCPRFLMYHSVSDDLTKSYKFSISNKEFKDQMLFLQKQNFTFCSLDDLLDVNKKISNKSVFITFDDGHLDNYYNVFPVIKDLGIKINIYISQFCENFKLLSNDMIIEMHKSGLVAFGCHTLNHKNLTKLNKSEVFNEISESKKKLEKLLPYKIKHFAYPYGIFNEDVVSVLKDLKIQTAVTTKKGIFSIKKIRNNLLEIPRINIKHDINLYKFRFAMLFGRYSF